MGSRNPICMKLYALSENEKKKLKFILVKFVEEIFIKIYVPC
jgi:hypothetical protein